MSFTGTRYGPAAGGAGSSVAVVTGVAVSIANATLLVSSTLPSRSVERYSSVWDPSSVTRTASL